MIIENDKLHGITLGATEYGFDGEGRFLPNRFTSKQREFYKRTNPDFYKKTFAGSGIRFDFVTDAESVEFDCLMRQSTSRPFCFTDVYCDGIMLLHSGKIITEPEMKTKVKSQLPDGSHRITVYFPNLVSMAAENFTLHGASFCTPYIPKYKFLCFGDSITQGYDAIYPSLSYANKTGAFFDAEILNQAIGGEIFNPGLPDAELPYVPDLITVAYGTNDWTHHRSAGEFTGNAVGFFDKITDIYPDKKILYISPIWRSALEAEAAGKPIPDFTEAVKMLENIAGSYKNVEVIHGYELTPHVEDFYSDGYLHPNDLGFSVYSEKLCEKIKRII